MKLWKVGGKILGWAGIAEPLSTLVPPALHSDLPPKQQTSLTKAVTWHPMIPRNRGFWALVWFVSM
jgi:hypothetical protein